MSRTVALIGKVGPLFAEKRQSKIGYTEWERTGEVTYLALDDDDVVTVENWPACILRPIDGDDPSEYGLTWSSYGLTWVGDNERSPIPTR